MIIKQLNLANFGIYGGNNWVFDLKPVPKDGFNRPIVLFKGKNGTGKTTFTEAIRLCLHGSLALGSRVSRSEYEAHLVKRIHVPSDSAQPPSSAKIGLVFDYVSVGRLHTYQVERSWQHSDGKLKESLTILEDNEELPDVDTPQQKESFLRELVPPNVADIFFFDGEKLERLSDDETGRMLLSDTIKTLLGLHLVDQLQQDLDVYLSRQELSQELKVLQRELETLGRDKVALEQERSHLWDERKANHEVIDKIQQQIAHQEQKIANQGSWFAERLDDLKATRQRLETEIEFQRKDAQELANGLLPFAIAPHMARLVAQRLQQEKAYEQAISARQALEESYERIVAEMEQPHYFSELEIDLGEEQRAKLFTRLKATLTRTTQPPSIDPDEIILRVSDQDRETLFFWIEQALDEIPRQFCQSIGRLRALEEELARVQYDLSLVPSDITLKPLVEILQSHNQDLGAARQIEQKLNERLERLDYQLEQMDYRLKAARQQIIDREQHDHRVQLASRTQLVLADYAQALTEEKATVLERILTKRFNQLSRKTDLVESVKIDRANFKITLYRKQQPFERKQLSAGEKQILAIATIWALREVSEVPMPVILDTPLGRLDSDHRLSMIENYIPRASHQVILLATDTEIDHDIEEILEPAISYRYDLTNASAQSREVNDNGQYRQLTLVDEGIAYETE